MTELPPAATPDPEAHARAAFMEAVGPTLDDVARDLGHKAVGELEQLAAADAQGRQLAAEVESYLANDPVGHEVERGLQSDKPDALSGVGFSGMLQGRHESVSGLPLNGDMLRHATAATHYAALEGQPGIARGIQAEAWQHMQRGLRDRE